MSIEDKLSGIGIKRMLVVDDDLEVLQAAKSYFDKLEGIQVDYAQSEKEAIDMIQKEYSKQKYDLVFSDKEMESQLSGAKVSYEALKHYGLGIVVDVWYPRSYMYGDILSVKMVGPKLEATIATPKMASCSWDVMTEMLANHYLTYFEGKEIFSELSQMHARGEEPSSVLASKLIKEYDFTQR